MEATSYYTSAQYGAGNPEYEEERDIITFLVEEAKGLIAILLAISEGKYGSPDTSEGQSAGIGDIVIINDIVNAMPDIIRQAGGIEDLILEALTIKKTEISPMILIVTSKNEGMDIYDNLKTMKYLLSKIARIEIRLQTNIEKNGKISVLKCAIDVSHL